MLIWVDSSRSIDKKHYNKQINKRKMTTKQQQQQTKQEKNKQTRQSCRGCSMDANLDTSE